LLVKVQCLKVSAIVQRGQFLRELQGERKTGQSLRWGGTCGVVKDALVNILSEAEGGGYVRGEKKKTKGRVERKRTHNRKRSYVSAF